jgi:hypothetical protein
MRLIRMIGFLNFDNKSFTSADVVSLQPDRVPCYSFFGSLMKGTQQNFLPVVLKVSLALEADKLEGVAK